MPPNELSALAGEDADARLANSKVLDHSFVCRLGAGQEGLKRRDRRGTQDIERVLDRGPVTFSALYREIASFVPCRFCVGIVWYLEIIRVAHLLFTFADRPTR